MYSGTTTSADPINSIFFAYPHTSSRTGWCSTKCISRTSPITKSMSASIASRNWRQSMKLWRNLTYPTLNCLPFPRRTFGRRPTTTPNSSRSEEWASKTTFQRSSMTLTWGATPKSSASSGCVRKAQRQSEDEAYSKLRIQLKCHDRCPLIRHRYRSFPRSSGRNWEEKIRCWCDFASFLRHQ